MKMYKVIPYYTKGGYPGVASYVFASNEKDAIKSAREKSGLGRFDSWDFSDCTEIKRNKKV